MFLPWDNFLSKEEGAEDKKIGDLVKKHVPEASLERSTMVECSFGLPREQYGKFSKIFDEIQGFFYDDKERQRKSATVL